VRFLNRSAGRLTRGRRGPVAGVVVLLLGLLMTGGLYAAFAPAQAGNAVADEELISEGRELFLVGCAFCHGQNGEGIQTSDGDQLGPTLVGVGAAAVDFQVGTGRMPLAAPGQQGPAKKQAYSESERLALAAYVATLGPGPAIPSEGDWSLEGLSDDEREEAVVRGGQIFLTNCTACHNFVGSGGAMPQGGYAPNVRNTSEEHVYEALLTGPGQMPSFSDGNLSQTEKRDVIAYLNSVESQPDYGGFGLGNLGPVVDGAVTWIIGIGLLVGSAVWIASHTTRTDRKKKGEVTS
jgi:ubiquinol-cytochrome c reductase cytochrome c subunit